MDSQVRRRPSSRGNLGPPTELPLRARDVEHAALNLSEASGRKLRFELRACRAPAELVQLEHRGLLAGAHVEDAAVLTGGGQRRPRHVARVDVVACLAAVAEDLRRLACCELPEEDCDHARLTVRVLPRPVDVAEAQRHVTRAVEPVVGGHVLLARQLRDAIRREGPALGVLRDGAVALPVDRPAGRAEHDLRAVAARGLEHPDRPADVHVGVVLRPLDRHAHVHLRAEMEADLGTNVVEVLVQRLAQVRHDEPRALGHVLALPVREVVEREHLVAALEQRLDDMRADEPRAPCDDRPQGLVS